MQDADNTHAVTLSTQHAFPRRLLGFPFTWQEEWFSSNLNLQLFQRNSGVAREIKQDGFYKHRKVPLEAIVFTQQNINTELGQE